MRTPDYHYWVSSFYFICSFSFFCFFLNFFILFLSLVFSFLSSSADFCETSPSTAVFDDAAADAFSNSGIGGGVSAGAVPDGVGRDWHRSVINFTKLRLDLYLIDELLWLLL